MINQNSISPESSSANQQGLAAKGKSGKSGQSKGLFSRLLETLQQGTQKGEGKSNKSDKISSAAEAQQNSLTNSKGLIKAVQVTSQKNSTAQESLKETLTAAHGKTAQLNHKAGNATINSGIKENSIEVEKQLISKVDRVKTETDGTDIIATIQEPSITPIQSNLTKEAVADTQPTFISLNKNKGNNPNLSTKQQTTETTSQAVDEKAELGKNIQSNVKNTEFNPAEQKQSLIQKVSAQAGAQLNQTEMMAKNVSLEEAKVTKNISALEPTQASTSKSIIAAETKQQTTASALNPEQPLSRTHQPNQETFVNQNNRVSETVVQAKQQISNPEQGISSLQVSSGKVENDAELKDGHKVSQSPVASLQQRSGHQSQNSHISINQNNSAIHVRMNEGGGASSQQDFSSNQQDIDISLMETGKAESKSGKGLDFQAQLAYRSQRSFTPADTMLEIVRSAKTGNTSLELQLEPANLGKVQVSIQLDAAKQIQIAFTVDQATSRQALEQQMPQLRLALAQQGLDLGGFSMQMNQQGGQQEQSGSANDPGADSDTNLSTASLSENEKDQSRIGVNLAANGHLSILA